METIDLAAAGPGKPLKIIEIASGRGLRRRLEALGIMEGTVITKVSTQLMHGPVVLKVRNTQVAIGFGMARKIKVQPVTP